MVQQDRRGLHREIFGPRSEETGNLATGVRVDRGGVVIVGGGQASSQLAVSLREYGYSDRISIIVGEGILPYQRPPLSKAFLKGEVTARSLPLRGAEFYDKNEIDILLSTRVTEILRRDRKVRLQNGKGISYDKLVLATGSVNRRLTVPGSDARGIFYLRSIADAEAIKAWLRPSMSVVVIGAGFVGLELACVVRESGASVVVLEAGDRMLARSVTPEASAFLNEAHKVAGISFEFGVTVAAFHGDGDVGSVEMSDGRSLTADMVLVGIGALAETELASSSGLASSNGIEVDGWLATSDPAISAIGDCASFFNATAGRSMRLESVQNAADHARALAATLSGQPSTYDAVPWFWSDQGPHRLQIAGLTQGHDRTVTRGDRASGRFSVFCYRNGRLVGVESLNQAADHMIARRLLAAQVDLPWAHAADPSFDLKALVGRQRETERVPRNPRDQADRQDRERRSEKAS
jgi:3-phenylpropionate/trans-cinnamate dioxygenase ferredoxin reductase component